MDPYIHTYKEFIVIILFHPSFLEDFLYMCVGFRLLGHSYATSGILVCVQYGTFVYYIYYTPPLRNQGVGWGLEWMIQSARTYTRLYIQYYIQLSTHHAPIYSRYNSIRQTPQTTSSYVMQATQIQQQQ
jgi:hypothetical protein